MSAAADVQAHADALFSAAASAVSDAIAADPQHHLKDRLGRKLVDTIHRAIDLAALGHDFSNLDQ